MFAEETKSRVKENEGVTGGEANEGVTGGEGNEGVTGGFSGAAETHVVNESNTGHVSELTDEVLAKLNMSQIVLHRQHANKKDMTPKELARKKFPPKCVSSPFVVDFGFGISGTSKLAPKCIFEEKYPFVNNIDKFDPYSPEGTAFAEFFDDWMISTQSAKDIYPEEKNNLPVPFIFGSIYVRKRDWFHTISYSGQLLSDEHIDVIFYYLRKKGKYDPTVAMRFTTTDWFFGGKIAEFYEKYVKANHDAAIIPEVNEISQYIQGFYCDANVPWDIVDHVLIPIHVKHGKKDTGHWVLGVLTFKDRCIHVYDSNRGALNDSFVTKALLPFAFMIPQFLTSTGFYGKRSDIDFKSDAYADKALYDPLLVNLVTGLPHQFNADCGAFIVAFAEYFIIGGKIDKKNFDIDTYGTRIGSQLWQYGLKKQKLGAMSDDEVKGRIDKKKKNKKRGQPKKPRNVVNL